MPSPSFFTMMDFNVVDVSTALGERRTGEQKNMTLFITCQRVQEKPDTDSKRDRVRMEVKIHDLLSELLKKHPQREQEVTAAIAGRYDLHVTIVEVEETQPFQLYIEIDIPNHPGLLYQVTGLLRHCFNINDMVIRPTTAMKRQNISVMISAIQGWEKGEEIDSTDDALYNLYHREVAEEFGKTVKALEKISAFRKTGTRKNSSDQEVRNDEEVRK